MSWDWLEKVIQVAIGLYHTVFVVRVKRFIEGMVFGEVRLGEVSTGVHRDTYRTRVIMGECTIEKGLPRWGCYLTTVSITGCLYLVRDRHRLYGDWVLARVTWVGSCYA